MVVTLTCEQCKSKFEVSLYKKNIARFCKHECYAESLKGKKQSDKWLKTMRGRTPWNKGKKWNKETRKKMSKAQKKRFKTESAWNKGMKFPERSKEKNHNWKGGTQSKDRLERVKFQKTIQKKVFERDNYTCQLCYKKGGYLQVNHIQPWADYIELRFDINNCRTVCMSCHYYITFNKPMSDEVKNWGHNLSHVEK